MRTIAALTLATLVVSASVRADDREAVPVVSEPGDVASLIYTAGTTGPSKGCMITHGYMMNLARLVLRITSRREDEVSWTPLPLFHVNGISSVLSTMVLGSTLGVSSRFSVSGFWPEIERHELVRFADPNRLGHARQVLELNRIERPLIAGQTNRRPGRSRHDVGTETHFANRVGDPGDFLFGGARFHYDEHGL